MLYRVSYFRVSDDGNRTRDLRTGRSGALPLSYVGRFPLAGLRCPDTREAHYGRRARRPGVQSPGHGATKGPKRTKGIGLSHLNLGCQLLA